jgi:hypothetical protein
MKKYILGIPILIVIVIAVIVNVNINSQNSNLSDLFSVNLNALSSESDANVRCKSDPKDTCTLSGGDEIEDWDERD